METATLYVDVENLQDLAKRAIVSTLAQWPNEFPKPSALRLYVTADQMQLWDIWASHEFPSLKLSVKGVQRYGSVSKNLADMTLVLDAIADLLKGRTSHVAVLSDDSDYVTLFSTITQEISCDDRNIFPFLWFVTDRSASHSPTLDDFLPSCYLHMIACADNKTLTSVNTEMKASDDKQQSQYESIAKTIIRRIPVGTFKSTNCMKIVKQFFPKHDLADADSAKFGTQFAKHIAPILGNYGVTQTNPGKNPRKYEMTEEAKKSVTAN